VRGILDYVFIHPWRLVMDSQPYTLQWWKGVIWGSFVWILLLVTTVILISDWLLS